MKVSALWTEPNTRIIAHRGARSLAPENTLAAARKAFELGADMWEFDVGLTENGELVVVHDTTLERTSNVSIVFPHRKPWYVSAFTLDELHRLDFGSWFNEKDPFGTVASGEVTPEELQSYVGEPIPTLRDALLFTRERGWLVNVEIKDLRRIRPDAEVVERVVALVVSLGMREHTLVSSFNHEYLRRIKEIDRSIATGLLVSATPDEDLVELLGRLDVQAYNPRYSAVRPVEISRLRKHGYGVCVWTVNDRERVRKLVELGAAGIITDFPQLLLIPASPGAPHRRG